MPILKLSLSIILLLFISPILLGQSQNLETKTQLGFQYKPIIPNTFIGDFKQTFQSENPASFSGTISQKFGFNTGVIIRHKFTSIFSFESGINFVKRNYNFKYQLIDSGIVAQSNVGFISYDVPINGLVYVRIGDNWYMNASAGLNFGFYPSSVKSQNNDFFKNHAFKQVTAARRKIQFGLNINYGFEYRLKKIGTFYVGASYQLPFSPIAIHQLSWSNNGSQVDVRKNVDGSFATLDFKFFLPK